MANNKPQSRSPSIAGSDRLKRPNLLGEDLLDQMPEIDEDEFAIDSSQLPVVCVYNGAPVRFTIAGRKYLMRHGDIAYVEANYAIPRQLQPGADSIPSVIELETNRKVLPVQDPRVPKDPESGTPMITLQKQRAAVEKQSNKMAGRPEGASAQ